MINLYELHAREKLGKPDDWYVFGYAFGPPYAPDDHYRFEGQCCPLKKNGYPNWRKGDESTTAVAWITKEEHMAWRKAWEERTGLCAECEGTGKAVCFLGRGGTKYRECSICQGTGKTTIEEVQP